MLISSLHSTNPTHVPNEFHGIIVKVHIAIIYLELVMFIERLANHLTWAKISNAATHS